MRSICLVLFLFCQFALNGGPSSLHARSMILGNHGFSQTSSTNNFSSKRNLAITLGILGVGVASWACWRWGRSLLKQMWWLAPKNRQNYVLSDRQGYGTDQEFAKAEDAPLFTSSSVEIDTKHSSSSEASPTELSFHAVFNGQEVHYTENDIIKEIEIPCHPLSKPVTFFRRGKTTLEGVGDDYAYGFAAALPNKNYILAQKMKDGTVKCWLKRVDEKEAVLLNGDTENFISKLSERFVKECGLIDVDDKVTRYYLSCVDAQTISKKELPDRTLYNAVSQDKELCFFLDTSGHFVRVYNQEKKLKSVISGGVIYEMWKAAIEHMCKKTKTPFVFNPETFLAEESEGQQRAADQRVDKTEIPACMKPVDTVSGGVIAHNGPSQEQSASPLESDSKQKCASQASTSKLWARASFGEEEVSYTEDDIPRFSTQTFITFFSRDIKELSQAIGDYSYAFKADLPNKYYILSLRMKDGEVRCWLAQSDNSKWTELSGDSDTKAWISCLCKKYREERESPGGKLHLGDIDPKTIQQKRLPSGKIVYTGVSQSGKCAVSSIRAKLVICSKVLGKDEYQSIDNNDVCGYWYAAMEHMYKTKTPFVFDPETLLAQ